MTSPNAPGVFKRIYQKWTGSNIDYDLTSYRGVLAEVQRYQSDRPQNPVIYLDLHDKR